MFTLRSYSRLSGYIDPTEPDSEDMLTQRSQALWICWPAESDSVETLTPRSQTLRIRWPRGRFLTLLLDDHMSLGNVPKNFSPAIKFCWLIWQTGLIYNNVSEVFCLGPMVHAISHKLTMVTILQRIQWILLKSSMCSSQPRATIILTQSPIQQLTLYPTLILQPPPPPQPGIP